MTLLAFLGSGLSILYLLIVENQKQKKIKNINKSIIILDKGKTKYDWVFYKFLLDNEILIDFTIFVFEFMDSENKQVYSYVEFQNKIYSISINDDINFNKKFFLIRKEKENEFYFSLNNNFLEDEKKVIIKLLNYLCANLITRSNKKKS